MSISILTSKGQVILKPITSDVSELKGLLPKPKKKISIEDMNTAIKKRGSRFC